MGLNTDFEGKFDLDRPLTPQQRTYLAKFSETRRMKRSATLLETILDPIREAVGLPIGLEGAYCVRAQTLYAQMDNTSDIINRNEPPEGQPGLWCQWTPNEDGTAVIWDGGDGFYNYVEWIKYLIEHFLKPWGYKVNGIVRWESEASVFWSDATKNHEPGISRGEIVVGDNVVRVQNDRIEWL